MIHLLCILSYFSSSLTQNQKHKTMFFIFISLSEKKSIMFCFNKQFSISEISTNQLYRRHTNLRYFGIYASLHPQISIVFVC